MKPTTVCLALFLGRLASAQVPVEQEPRHHLAFENQALRVIEPQIPAGDTTLEHLHAHDDATVCIHGSSVRAKQPGADWGNAGMECKPGSVNVTEYTGRPRSHIVQNVGSGEYHLTLVENLRGDGWTAYDPLTVDGLKVIRENRAFRAYEVSPDSPTHSHRVPAVVVLVSGDISAGDKHLDRPGQAVLIPAGVEHRVVTHGESRVVEIEVR